MEGMAGEAGVTLEAAAADSGLAVDGDHDRLIQTLTNLISNAIKFAPPDTVVRASVEAAGDDAVFRVEDQGRGIPVDKLELIFRAFEQVDGSDSREKGGTGLGLAICQMIVARHGGRIWAESTVGRGSTFSFTIPLVPAQVQPTSERDGPTVLIGDDDASIREVLGAILTRRGYRVLTAGSGEEVVRSALDERPDAVLLDLMMPGFNGWETVDALRRRPETSAIPIVIVSVLVPEPGHAADGWVQKPVDERALFATLDCVLHPTVENTCVLLVEDDLDLAAMLIARLRSHGVRTIHAASVQAAITTIRGTTPDLLILDPGLPDGDGFELAEEMRRHDRLRSLPTIVYSAGDVPDADRPRLTLGETRFRVKSRTTPDELDQCILDILRRAADGPSTLTAAS
jgi:DNA-binding response OmpR family regulator/anti-sigma regulatory factor (Ser/Thr protein kinase)